MQTNCELLTGFHPPEESDEGPFRWTRGAFEVRPAANAGFLRLILAYLGEAGTLSLIQDGAEVDRVPLARGWQTRALRLRAGQGPLRLSVDPVVAAAGDRRELGIMLRELTLFADETRAAALAELGSLEGCYPTEHDAQGTFVWARGMFRIRPLRGAKFMALEFGYPGAGGTLTLAQRGQVVDRASLKTGWQELPLRLPAGDDWLTLSVDPINIVPSDSRELGVRLRAITLFDDERRYANSRALADNFRLNDEEFRQGRSVLASRPPNLRITAETRCNIPETSQACAYCAWDWAKEMERGSPEFRLNTLDQLGDLYRHASALVDCSIGEPTMNKQFGQILARLDSDGKKFSFTTNGQLLVERRRRELLGKDVTLYVSIDSATAEGFKRYRNDRFDDMIVNLRALCREKRAHGNLPTVFASFIAMRSNRHELAEYLDLMKDVGVDQVKLRALYLDDNVTPVVMNNHYRFDYAAEILSMAELGEVGSAARRLAADCGVTLYVEWEEFEAAEKRGASDPLCAEPWKTLYVLRRGVMPCCYATEPIARWEEQGDRPLDQFLLDTFNSPGYQEIRRELAAGRLAAYCRNTPSCPVLKQTAHTSREAGLAEPQYRPDAAASLRAPHLSLPVLSPASAGGGCSAAGSCAGGCSTGEGCSTASL